MSNEGFQEAEFLKWREDVMLGGMLVPTLKVSATGVCTLMFSSPLTVSQYLIFIISRIGTVS